MYPQSVAMDEVLKLVNRLQSACTLLGDTAGQKDSDLPGLWEMLPSIVVIGGQVYISCKVNKRGLYLCCSSATIVQEAQQTRQHWLFTQDLLVTCSSF